MSEFSIYCQLQYKKINTKPPSLASGQNPILKNYPFTVPKKNTKPLGLASEKNPI